jgi:hypothetical protein
MVRRNFMDEFSMSALSVARQLIAEERAFRGVKTPEARGIVAREAGLTAGTLENLERGRLVKTDGIAERLNAYWIRKIEQRISSLRHELAVARAAQNVAQPDLERAQSAIETAQRAIHPPNRGRLR